jgi:uncharacterized membrane protein YphA (DoxX/SURF4 family)
VDPSFADALSSSGLLLLRVATAITLAVTCWKALASGSPELILVHSTAMVLGILLLVGLWTQITAVVVIALELFSLYTHNSIAWPNVLLSGFGVALLLLGAGRWSVDARLSGWKRINIPHRGRELPSQPSTKK